MSIPPATTKLVGLREVADRLGVSHESVRYWWKRGKLIGRRTGGRTRARIAVPIEVVDYYLRYFRLPNKLDLYLNELLDREYLLELRGPDGGLSEIEDGPGSTPDDGGQA